MANNVTNQPMYLVTGDPETENNQTMLYPGMLGSKMTIQQPGPQGAPGAEAHRSKTYQSIQVDSTAAVTPYAGAVAWWSDKTRYLVTTSPTALGRGAVAGVFQNAINPGWFGFVQTKGPATTKFVDAPTAAPTAARLFVIPSATAGKADALAAGSAASYPLLGYSASALNPGDQTAIVDLDVPDTP